MLALLLHATLGRGLHELQHLRGVHFGAWSAGQDASRPQPPDDAPGGHALCAWCAPQAHAAPGGPPPQALASPSRPLRVVVPRPAPALPNATRRPYSARDPPRALG